MQQVSVYIIIPDTIKSVGVKYLLKKLFDINAYCTSDISFSETTDNSSTSIIITTTEYYSVNLDFFIPRRSRTIILSETDSDDKNVVYCRQDESSIIERMRLIIEDLQLPDEDKKQNNLSQREIDVLKLVAMGYINKEIADKLSISFNTVLSHRKNITAKLGIKSASGLGFYAIMNGYISENDIKH